MTSMNKSLLKKWGELILIQSKNWIDLSPYKWYFDLDKSGEKFHHILKEHHKISNIPKFRCKML
jgi:hypothetical protein